MAKKILLFLDYDGTLTPIRSRPEKAVLAAASREKLRRLLTQPAVKVVIISGRKLSVLKKLVRIPEFIYIGNHGFEMEIGRKHRLIPGVKKYLSLLQRIKKELARSLRMKGVLIEDKELTLSVHYRMVGKKALPEFRRRFAAAIGKWQKTVRVTSGKAVYEIRPPLDWHKGRAVIWLIKTLKLGRYFPVYIGDDKTDEDAFRALRRRGRSFFVGGKRPAAADRRLPSIGEVYRLLADFAAGKFELL